MKLYSQVQELQPRNFAYTRSLDKPYENEVTLREQNPRLKGGKTLKRLIESLDLSLQALKGLQSCCSSNFENDSNAARLKHTPHVLAHTLVVIGNATLTPSNFVTCKKRSKPILKIYQELKRPAAF